jgi:hypothetical protein
VKEAVKTPFFVGWRDVVPSPLREFLLLSGLLLVLAMGALALIVSRTSPDGGPGSYGAETVLRGVLELRPYAVLRLPAGGTASAPRTMMLSGEGKHGVLPNAAALAGKPAEAGGVLLKRGTLDMLQVGGPVGLRPDAGASAFTPAPVVPLGRWRLTGEICDGKCLAGAMKPGSGLAHKACANLCIAGGIPPVFVSEGAVDGTVFFLMTGPGGVNIPDRFYDLVGLRLAVEGTVERLDDLHVFMADPASIKVP